jgi:glycosyltransferase involved in cell wall biosynthesis
VVLCEALGAGTPTIFSKECNFSELEAHGAGIMPREFDVALWANAIDKICLDRFAQEKLRAAAERLRPQYTWQEISRRWQSLYDAAATSQECDSQ